MCITVVCSATISKDNYFVCWNMTLFPFGAWYPACMNMEARLLIQSSEYPSFLNFTSYRELLKIVSSLY